MEDKLTVNVSISITRETYQVWKRVFSDRRIEKLGNDIFNLQKKHENQKEHENNDSDGIPEQDIQECFEVGLRVLDVLSPNFLKQKEEVIREYERRITMLRLSQGFPPF
jgi:hypothetical protein